MQLKRKMKAPEYERGVKAILKKGRSEIEVKLDQVANWLPSHWQLMLGIAIPIEYAPCLDMPAEIHSDKVSVSTQGAILDTTATTNNASPADGLLPGSLVNVTLRCTLRLFRATFVESVSTQRPKRDMQEIWG